MRCGETHRSVTATTFATSLGGAVMSKSFRTPEEAYKAMMKYIELYKDDRYGSLKVLFERREFRGDVSWIISLPDDKKFPLRGGRADPSGGGGTNRQVKQTMCVRHGARFDHPSYCGWQYLEGSRPVLYYFVIDPEDERRYLVSPPSLDEPYDDEDGNRRYGGPVPKLLGDYLDDDDTYSDPFQDGTVATGLRSDGESLADGWAEYGPNADQNE